MKTPREEDKRFGVSTGKKSWLIDGQGQQTMLRTSDGLVHHIRVIDRTGRWLRYVLRHDQREYLIVAASVYTGEAPVTCLICVNKGPERAGEDEDREDS